MYGQDTKAHFQKNSPLVFITIKISFLSPKLIVIFIESKMIFFNILEFWFKEASGRD